MYINLTTQSCNAISYIFTFKIGNGTHSKHYESRSAEANILCSASVRAEKTLFTEEFEPNLLSRLTSGSNKQFGAVWVPIFGPPTKSKQGRLKKGPITAYRLSSPVEVESVDQLIRKPLLKWEG